MAKFLEIDVDASRALAKLAQLGDRAEALVRQAALETAQAIAREAAARLRRQLSPAATGQTAESLIAELTPDGRHAVVWVDTTGARTGQIMRRDRPRQARFPNLDLVLEFGSRPASRGARRHSGMAARPFLAASATAEEAAHFHRVEAALDAAIDDVGLGD